MRHANRSLRTEQVGALLMTATLRDLSRARLGSAIASDFRPMAKMAKRGYKSSQGVKKSSCDRFISPSSVITLPYNDATSAVFHSNRKVTKTSKGGELIYHEVSSGKTKISIHATVLHPWRKFAMQSY